MSTRDAVLSGALLASDIPCCGKPSQETVFWIWSSGSRDRTQRSRQRRAGQQRVHKGCVPQAMQMLPCMPGEHSTSSANVSVFWRVLTCGVPETSRHLVRS